MTKRPQYWISLVLVTLMLSSLACNLGGEEATATPEPTLPPTAVPTQAPAATTPPEVAPPASKAVASLQDVRTAVIQIEAQGSFVDPQVGLRLNVAGQGLWLYH